MNSPALRRAGIVLAAASTTALVLAGCAGGSGGGGEASADPNEKVTLTLATFNNFGYTDELLQEYMDENPNVTIVHNKAAESGDARKNYFQKLGKEGLADIEAVEVDWFAEAMQYSDLLAEVPDERQGPLAGLEGSRARPTPTAASSASAPTSARRRSATAPTCSRPPACRATPDEVAALFDGDWNNYFDVADQYKAATGKPMIDAANSVLQGIVNQIEYTYDEPDGKVIATTTPRSQDAYNTVVERADPELGVLEASGATTGTRRWRTASSPRCSARRWMLGIIAGNAPEVTGWKVANVFPNGGGNWGGSYLTVPGQRQERRARRSRSLTG